LISVKLNFYQSSKKEFNMTLGSIITWIVVGGISGFLAEHVIGGWLFQQFHINIGVAGWLNTIITAFVGAVVLLLGIRILRRV
jgi:uncharacterized membrane protein YeaQ/YmgE (transglycosylase-associated protein family)